MRSVFRSGSKFLASKMGLVVLAACLAIVSAPAISTGAAPPPKQFLANINASQETPPVASNAFGVAHLTFDETTKLLCFSISYSGLVAPELLAHIHGPALPGVPGGIVFGLPPGSPKSGCTPALSKMQKAELLKNLWYINVHTGFAIGGEIRGQILRIK